MNTKYPIYYLTSPECKEEEEKYLSVIKNNENVNPVPKEYLNATARSCVYITSYSSGVLAEDVEPVTTQFESWLIIVSKINGASEEEGFKHVKAKWESQLYNKNIALKVISGGRGFEESLTSWVSNEVNYCNLKIPEGGMLLIASPKPQTGKTSLMNLIKDDISCSIVEKRIDDSDYKITCNRAVKVLFVCDDIVDFAKIEPFDDGMRKTLFILNKCDFRPAVLQDVNNTKLKIIEALAKNGWDITPSHSPKILIYSILYANYYRSFNNELSVQYFAENEDFAICDEFGLPIPRKDYTKKNIEETLSTYNCTQELVSMIQ